MCHKLRPWTRASSHKSSATAHGASQKSVPLSDSQPRRCQLYDNLFSVFYRYKCSSDICRDGYVRRLRNLKTGIASAPMRILSAIKWASPQVLGLGRKNRNSAVRPRLVVSIGAKKQSVKQNIEYALLLPQVCHIRHLSNNTIKKCVFLTVKNNAM